ncbi:MAG: hypothetical protein KC668_26640 [Myxococcales bacterium]|nr:hypothetical protein [Myxococcales bacterium]
MSASAPRPQPPFDRWPVHVFDPDYGFVWWAGPAAVVSQSIIPRGTIVAAEKLQSCIDAALTQRADEIAAQGGVFIFHDWRVTTGYESDARKHYLSRMRARPANYLRHSVVAVEAHPLFKMAVEAGNLVAALTARARVEIVRDPRATLAQEGFAPATQHPFP